MTLVAVSTEKSYRAKKYKPIESLRIECRECHTPILTVIIMREKTIEQKLVQSVKAHGGICPKLVCPGMAGMPDRLVLLPGGKMGFVEVKAPGEKPRPLQTARHRILSWLGFKVFVLDDPEEIEGIVNEIRTT